MRWCGGCCTTASSRAETGAARPAPSGGVGRDRPRHRSDGSRRLPPERYGVPAHDILREVGQRGYVGGQEDMIIDVALELAGR